ncbi:MAG: hypothetical protein NZ805_16390 [Armatimonadetes bacterium]|nr:hypothetical protein [Armatimonadota bacterium]
MRPNLMTAIVRSPPQFQSHCGAIATVVLTFVKVKMRSFNPTVVRLRPLCASSDLHP